MRSLAMISALGLFGCVSFPSAHLVLDATMEPEQVAAPVVCGPMGFRRAPLQSRWGEYVRVTVGSAAVLRGTAFVHANGVSEAPRSWTTADGNLVIEARFENLDPDARFALPQDRPIDVTITNLEAVNGTCEGAVFTVEQGELIPSISEGAWLAELERRGGDELVARRQARELDYQARRAARYALSEERRAAAALLPDDYEARRAARYALSAQRREDVIASLVQVAGQGEALALEISLPPLVSAGAVACAAPVGESREGVIAIGEAARTCTTCTTEGWSGWRGVEGSGEGVGVRDQIGSNCSTCGTSSAVGGATYEATIETERANSTGCATCGTNATAVGGTLNGGSGSVGCATCATVGGSTYEATLETARVNSTNATVAVGGSTGCATCGTNTTFGTNSTVAVNGSIGCATCGTNATVAVSGTNVMVGGAEFEANVEAHNVDGWATYGGGAGANASGGGAILVDAPPTSVEWTAYPTEQLPPPTPVVAVVTAPAQPICDEACQAANTLGFVIPMFFDVMLNVPVPQPPPQRVVKAVPLGSNR